MRSLRPNVCRLLHERFGAQVQTRLYSLRLRRCSTSLTHVHRPTTSRFWWSATVEKTRKSNRARVVEILRRLSEGELRFRV